MKFVQGVPTLGAPPQGAYYWPSKDTDSMKLIWKEPTPRYPYGFHVLASRYHPIGDFDTPELPNLPKESLRIYKTKSGFRIFFTGRYNVEMEPMLKELDAMGGDQTYSRVSFLRGYYAVRVQPKRLVDQPVAVARFLRQEGTPLPAWNEFIARHDELTNAVNSSVPLA